MPLEKSQTALQYIDILAGANVERALDRGAAIRGHRLREGGPKVQAEVRDPGEERNQQEGLGAQ